jgi:hypothetical protein
LTFLSNLPQVRASFFDEIANKVERKNENVTLDFEMRESHQLCEDMFIFSKVFMHLER